MSERIYLSAPHMGGEELEFVKEAFATNWISPAGPHLVAFEKELGKYLPGVSVAALSSGTAAIHLALILLGVKNDDEVICSTFTFSGSCNPVAYVQAHPVFVDSEPDTWNMDPELLRQAIVDRLKRGKKPKAIIVVHLYGMPAKMEEIRLVAEEFQIPLVEDAAESLGSNYRGQPCGTFGLFGILSFNGNKIITTSGGGALTSRDERMIEKARYLSTQARDPAPHYQHSEIGYNYRLSNVCAGIGRGQLRVLDERVKRRREIFERYQQNFRGTPIEFQPESEGHFSNRWLTCILFDRNAPQLPEKIRILLENFNIESRPLWKPMHLQPVFATCPFYGNGTSQALFDRGLCLPSGTNLTNDTVDRVSAMILEGLT